MGRLQLTSAGKMLTFIIAAPLRAFSSQSDARLCPTPGGWHPCDCTHEVESGTRIDEVRNSDGTHSALIHHPNGTVRRLAQCPHSRLPRSVADGLRRRSDDKVADNPCKLGWAHAAPMEAFYQHSHDIARFSVTYTVPDPPSSVGDNILYYWIGLQDTSSRENPVIQPVLSYVKGSDPNNWYFESWNCCPAGHKLKAASVPIQGSGATVHGSIERDISGLFTISSNDSSGNASVLYSNDTLAGTVRTWNWVDIVLETYSVESCSDYSAGGFAQFLNAQLVDTVGQSVTPVWSMRPYIDAAYLSPSDGKRFTACCNGSFTSNWPNATMHQNSAAIPESLLTV